MKTAAFTIVSKNYIAMAKTLMDSLKDHQESWDRFVILVDDYSSDEAKMLEDPISYELVKAVELDLPDARKMFFRYNILELNTAVKPWGFEMLFYDKGYDHVIYLDPDICVYDKLTEVENKLEKQGAIVLTPHILKPIYDDKRPAELDLMRAGIYNLGFIAVSKGEQTKGLLEWWQSKLEYECVVDLPSGLFVDQKWMDFVPAIFDEVTILKHHGYNVAYWNLMQRIVERKDNKYFVDGEPLIFFHFSGLNPMNIKNFSKHQNRFEINDIGRAKDIVKEYASKVIINGFKESSKLVYAYDFFEDGLKINQMIRNCYNKTPYLIEKCGANPYDHSELFTGGCVDKDYQKEIVITPVMHEIWGIRPDLQRAFPDYKKSQRYHYAKWFVQSAKSEYNLDYQYIQPIKECLDNLEKSQINGPYQIPLKNNAMNLHRSLKPIVSKFAKKSKPIIKSICKEETWERLKQRYFEFVSEPPAEQITAEYQTEMDKTQTHSNADSSKGINLVAYIRGDFGVGEAGRATAKSVKQSGIPLSIINFEQDIPHYSNNRDWDDFITKDFKYNVNVFNVNADQTPALEQAYNNDVWNGRYNIGYWVWELPELPEEWKRHCSRFNEIWAPSSFNVEAFSQKSPVPVVRIPYSIDVKVDKNINRDYFGLPNDKFLYLFMYDVLSFQVRKNPEAVIKAFEAAFAKDNKNVGLVIKINNGKQAPNEVKKLQQQFSDRSNIFFIDRIMTKIEVNSLINNTDCFVSLHRSEGFGLGLAESMFLGKPAIGTNWSSNTDFMNNKNSCPVDYKLIKVGQDYGPYKAHQHWADPDIEHAAEYMKKLYNSKQYYDIISKNGEKTIKEEFSAEAVSRMIKNRLDSLNLL